jgi:hypothetical protein
MTSERLIEIADSGSHDTILTCCGRKAPNNDKRLVPEAILRQCPYLSADGFSISAAGVYCRREAVHTRLLLIISKLHVGKEPQQLWRVRRSSQGFLDHLASRRNILSFEQLRNALLDEMHWIIRCSISRPASSAYYAHNLSMPEPVSFGHVLTVCQSEQ